MTAADDLRALSAAATPGPWRNGFPRVKEHRAMAATGPFLNIQETADEWGVSRRTVGALIASGQLPHRRIGPGRGRVVTTAEDREEYLEAHREGQAGGEARDPAFSVSRVADARLIVWLRNHADALADLIDAASDHTTTEDVGDEWREHARLRFMDALAALEADR